MKRFLAGFAVTFAVFSPIAPTSASAVAPTSAPRQADTPSIRLVEQNQFVRGTESAQLTMRLARTGLPDPPERVVEPVSEDKAGTSERRPVDRPPSPYAVVIVALAPTVTRADVQRAVDNIASGAPVTDVLDAVTVPYEDVDLRGDDLLVRTSVEIAANEDDNELWLPYALVYPLIVTVTKDGAPVARLQTFVERLPIDVTAPREDPLGTMSISVVGTIDGGPTLLPNGATANDPAVINEVRRVTDVLARNPDLPVTLGIRPEVAEGLDRSREISERTLLTEMATALGARELVSETYVHVDPSSLVAADLGSEFVSQLRRGEDALAQAFPRAVTVRSTSIIDRPLTADGADLLRDLGVRSVLVLPDPRATLGSDGASTADPSMQFNLSLSSGGVMPALVVDPTIAATADSSPADPLAAAYQLMADLVAWTNEIRDSGGSFTGRSVVLTGADGRLPDGLVLEAFTRLVEDDPRFELVPLGQSAVTTDVQVVDGIPVIVEPSATPSTDESNLAFALNITRVDTETTGSMLPDGDPRTQRWDALMDIAPSLDLDEAARSSYLDTVLAETAALRASVSGPPRTTFTLGGREGDITLSIRNDADVALTVVVRLTSPKLLFPDGLQTEELAPNATTIVRVQVEARSNNKFPVVVELLTPDRLSPVSPPVQLTARVTAFTGLGQLVTGAGAIILATWWVRHWRANRRRRMAEAAGGSPAPAT